MCNAAASKPAGSPGPPTFSKIQENVLLYSQKLVLPPLRRGGGARREDQWNSCAARTLYIPGGPPLPPEVPE